MADEGQYYPSNLSPRIVRSRRLRGLIANRVWNDFPSGNWYRHQFEVLFDYIDLLEGAAKRTGILNPESLLRTRLSPAHSDGCKCDWCECADIPPME